MCHPAEYIILPQYMIIVVLLLVQFLVAIVLISSGLVFGLQLHSPRRCAKELSATGPRSLRWLVIDLGTVLAVIFAIVASFVATVIYLLPVR